jgi:hypothetical protein
MQEGMSGESMPGDRQYSKHQLKIINNYYKTANERSLQGLQEIAAELYLATSEKKKAQLWERARKAMETLGIKPKMIEHIMASGKPEVLAQHVKDMF